MSDYLIRCFEYIKPLQYSQSKCKQGFLFL
jgi:hypothetical protein